MIKVSETRLMRGTFFNRLLLSYLLVSLVTGVGIVVLAGLISPELYKLRLDQIALFLRPEFVQLRLTLEQGYRQTILQAFGIAVPVSLAVGAASAYLYTRRLRLGLKKLAAKTHDIALGRYDQRLEVAGDDELSVLAADFNTMTEALAKAEQRRVELIGTVAHELNTPLAVQQGYTEALADELVTPEEAAKAIMLEVSTMRRLTHDLLLVTKAEAGTFALSPAPYTPAALVADVLDRFTTAFEEKGIVLETSLANELPPVYADRERVAQVLGNLLANALRHTPGSGRITLRAKPCEGCVEFSVADTGPGIAEEHQPFVFRRFYRAEPSGQDGSGMGIGLTVSRGLVQAMGGHIWLQSRPAQGATFYFTLPCYGTNYQTEPS